MFLRFAHGSMVAVHELVSLLAFIEAGKMCSLVNIFSGVEVQCAGVVFQRNPLIWLVIFLAGRKSTMRLRSISEDPATLETASKYF